MAYRIEKALELLEVGRELVRQDPCREGNVIVLPNYGQVVMTGDLHGYKPNLQKLKRFASLKRSPQRHVVLHEILHVNSFDVSGSHGGDDSCQLLLSALKWKIDYPEQVHFMLGNHDLAQITNREISKAGGPSIAMFNEGVYQSFGSDADMVLEAINRLLLAFPLAARCPNRIWLSHSLPGPYALDEFDMTIFGRQWEEEDLLPGGSVYELVWGRMHTQSSMEQLCDLFDVDHFVVGHQGQSEGFECQFGHMIILASEHPNGCFMPIDLSKDYDIDDLIDRVRYFYQVTLPGERETV